MLQWSCLFIPVRNKNYYIKYLGMILVSVPTSNESYLLRVCCALRHILSSIKMYVKIIWNAIFEFLVQYFL
jgi:hypothetical protein